MGEERGVVYIYGAAGCVDGDVVNW